MPYRLTLLENLPANAPSVLTVTYTYNDGSPTTVWPVVAVGSDTNTAVIIVNCAHSLIAAPNVATRTLNAHYAVPPNLRDITISSVQLPHEAEDGHGEPNGSGSHEAEDGHGEPNGNGSHDHFYDMSADSTPYAVTIKMTQDTVNALSEQGFKLYGFKAVKTTAGGGTPVIWFQTTTFGLSTAVTWTEQYQAYTTNSQAITNGQITATNAYDIKLQQTLDVTSTTGTGNVDTLHGVASAISILNRTSMPFTCGISQLQSGVAMPMCAFPLNGNMLDVIAPIEQVLLMFSTTAVNTGAVIYQAFSQGVMLNLTSEQSMQVSFDINTSWDWGGGPDGQIIPAQANLVPFLIQRMGHSAMLTRNVLAGGYKEFRIDEKIGDGSGKTNSVKVRNTSTARGKFKIKIHRGNWTEYDVPPGGEPVKIDVHRHAWNAVNNGKVNLEYQRDNSSLEIMAEHQ
jgi:hypothetical protein